jgi:radical SAM modification target selenobiotic family peptide
MAGIIINLWYGDKMDSKELKKMLAGLSLVALIGGAGLSVSGCATTGSSSWSDTKDSAGSTEKVEKAPAASSWTGIK